MEQTTRTRHAGPAKAAVIAWVAALAMLATIGVVSMRGEQASADTSTYTAEAASAPPAQGPIWVRVTAGVDPRWQVDRAAQIWNTAVGCRLFTLVSSPRVEDVTVVYQVRRLDAAGTYYTDSGDIRLDPTQMSGHPPHPVVALHELGHALGLQHSDSSSAVMSGHVLTLQQRSMAPTISEVNQVRRLQKKRCPGA